jgi:hypothetical protein
LFERYVGYNFRAFFVVTEDAEFVPATAAYCAEKQTQFGLDMPVLTNPAGDLVAALETTPNDVDVVTRCGAVTLKDDYQHESDVRAAIDAALGL